MKEIITAYLPYFLSAITIYTMFLVGNRYRFGWLVGLLNQILWFIWIISSGTFGLMPLTIAMTVIYIRNYKKWKREEIVAGINFVVEKDSPVVALHKKLMKERYNL